MNMYKIYDESGLGEHPIVSSSQFSLNLIFHLLDWIMGRDDVYKGTAYVKGQLIEEEKQQEGLEEALSMLK